MSVKYFLAKTDPETYSIEDFKKEKETLWDGVHNYAAMNFIKMWEIGDKVLIYHSMGKAKIVGLAEVISSPRPNKDDPRPSWVADLRFIKEFPEKEQIGLKQVKESGRFADFALVRQSRLSTMSCPLEFIDWLKEVGVNL
jgi:predicted RNA-binding protein with PUA-like domain